MEDALNDSKNVTVNIRPEVTILSVLQHLNYKPWFALAEFVDNALQSFNAHRSDLKAAGVDRLKVEIDVDPEGFGRIVIRDNAAGIFEKEFPRAFRPAELPADRSGLSEFGMGMKSAACWFARKWSVRTKALGEDVERTVVFDIDQILDSKQEQMIAVARRVPRDHHYTEVVLEHLHHPPKGRTLGKVKEHLASIYRIFLREGALDLYFRGEKLSYNEPRVLVASNYRQLGGETLKWHKEINFDFGSGQRVVGFAALRETASTPYAGFALFRRSRLVEGSADETYRPLHIFGNSNSYRYQRLFGELHLDGFEVSHTKDGFRWEEHEDVFLDCLREELEKEPLNLLDQAEGHRIRATKQWVSERATEATKNIAEILERDIPAIVSNAIQLPLLEAQLPPTVEKSLHEITARTININNGVDRWEVTVRTTLDPSQGDWLQISERRVRQDQGGITRCVIIDVSLAHPFVTSFGGPDAQNTELILRMAACIAIALLMTEDATSVSPSFALHYINTLLREALSSVS